MFFSEYVYKKLSRYFHPIRFKPARIPPGMYLVDHGAPFPQKVPLWNCFEVENVGGGSQLKRIVYFYSFTRLSYRTAGLEWVALYNLKMNLLNWI